MRGSRQGIASRSANSYQHTTFGVGDLDPTASSTPKSYGSRSLILRCIAVPFEPANQASGGRTFPVADGMLGRSCLRRQQSPGLSHRHAAHQTPSARWRKTAGHRAMPTLGDVNPVYVSSAAAAAS